MPLVRTSLITDEQGLRRLAPQWAALLQRSACDEPMRHPMWLMSWWSLYGPAQRRRLHTVAVWREDRLVGLLPLCLRWHRYRRGIYVRRLELLGNEQPEERGVCSEYLGPIIEAGLERPVAQAMAKALVEDGRRGLSRWHELILDATLGDDPAMGQLLDALTRRGYECAVENRHSAPVAHLNGTWADWQASLPSRHRYQVRKAIRQLEAWAEGPLVVGRVGVEGSLADGDRILKSLHAARWRHADKTGVFNSPIFSAFHNRVQPWLQSEGALDLLWLTVAGPDGAPLPGVRPLAALYNIRWGGRIYFYQSGRRMDLPEHLQPGLALHALAIQGAIAAGCTAYDFMAGDARYKRTLSTGERTLVSLRLSPFGWRSVARSAALSGRALVRRWRQNAL